MTLLPISPVTVVTVDTAVTLPAVSGVTPATHSTPVAYVTGVTTVTGVTPVTHFVGIDPGIGGAIGVVDAAGQFVTVRDMPTLPTSTGRRQVDPAALALLLRDLCPVFALVERVGARPGEGAVGAFAFGHTFGSITGVLAAVGIPHDLVQPAVWKRKAGIPPGADKGVSIATAKRLLPAAVPHLTRFKDDGRAEALLLALQAWERRQTLVQPVCCD